MKYPRIPHVPFSNITDPDDIVSHANIFGKEWVLTEKIDGAQMGFQFINDDIDARNRNTLLLHGDMDRQFSPLPAWVQEHYESLWEMLGNVRILFGEWLFHVHAVHYTRLPDLFVSFDLYDKEKEAFLPFEGAMRTCSEHGFATVPVIAKAVIRDKDHLLFFIGKSAFSDGEMEGIVLHSIDGNTKIKYVTRNFRRSIEDNPKHWRACERTKNVVKKEMKNDGK